MWVGDAFGTHHPTDTAYPGRPRMTPHLCCGQPMPQWQKPTTRRQAIKYPHLQ
ncbi:MAG: hypothetical protein JWO38_3274 [Gemmataceae bacterium]|nr:hypothetical protein [Gemmataceae bacterium]